MFGLRRSENRYVAVLIILFVIAAVMVILSPEPLDWSPSFSRDDTIPYGAQILYELLPELFPEQEISVSERPIFNTLTGLDTKVQFMTSQLENGKRTHPDSTASRSETQLTGSHSSRINRDSTPQDSNYIFINTAFDPDELDTRELLAFVARGNSAFVAAHTFSGAFADTLNLATQIQPSGDDSLGANLVNPTLKRSRDFIYKKGAAAFYFQTFDTARTAVLGKNSRGKVNFTRLAHGRGQLFLHSVPLALTNYNLLFRNNADYAALCLSHLPVQPTIWDEYYKAEKRLASTPLRFVLSRAPLRRAWYLGLATLALFILFESKRRQRPIPVIRPPANTTLDFVETVGQLYYLDGNHKNLAEKRIAYFLDGIRTKYHLRTNERSETLYEKIAENTGKTGDQVDAIFARINQIRQKQRISEDELWRLHRLLSELDPHNEQ